MIVAASKGEFEASVPQVVSPALRVTRAVGNTLVPVLLVGTIIILGLRLLRGSALRMDGLQRFMRLRDGRFADAAKPNVTFADVAGVDGAKLELREARPSRAHAALRPQLLTASPPGG